MHLQSGATSQFLFHRVLLLLIVAVRGRILRLGCLQYANFDVIYSNGVLQGSVIATFAGLSSQQCEEECIAERECKSINSENNGARACELNSKSTADPLDGVSLNSKEGWTYKSTSYNDRLVSTLGTRRNFRDLEKLDTSGITFRESAKFQISQEKTFAF